jgi:hypothetical protein
MIIASISNQRSDHHYWIFRGVSNEQLQNYATVELNLRSFAQSKRAHDPLSLLFWAFVGARLDWPEACHLNKQS